jgi:hypothetical protein
MLLELLVLVDRVNRIFFGLALRVGQLLEAEFDHNVTILNMTLHVSLVLLNDWVQLAFETVP